MRYFIFYPPTKSTRLIDVGENVYVEEILKLVEQEFNLKVDSHGLSETSIILSYNGFELKPRWSLADLNIPSGSIIRCIFKEKKAADLYIHCEFNKQILKLFDSSIKIETPISLIRKKISDRLGLPLSIFCLETYHGRTRLYDQMNLMNYDIKIHDHLVLKIWKGYEKFISSCIRGYAEHYSHDDLTRYYQMQVALHIAAYYGHMELASSVMQLGARSDRPVGEHPSRQWSFEAITNTVPEALKCPIHIAIERGHVKIVDLFVRQSILCTQIRDPTTGYLPYRLALSCLTTSAKTKQQKQCLSEIYFFLHDKQYNLKIPLNATGEYVTSLLTSRTDANTIHHTTTNHVNVSLPFYCRIISWYERARETAWKKFGGHFYTLTQTKRVYPRQGLLGYKVLIDGYNNTFEVPTEQLRSVHSGGTLRSDTSDLNIGYNEDERGKILRTKIFMKQFALDEQQRTKQIATTNLQHSRRPPLVLPRILANETKHSMTTTSQILEGTSSLSQFSMSHIVPSLSSENLKLFKSNFDADTPQIDKLQNSELIRKDNHSLQEKSKRKPKFHQPASTVAAVSDDDRYKVSNVLTKKFETLADPNKQPFQSIMSSAEAFSISSSRIALETEQRNAMRKRDLFTQIEQTLQQRTQQPSEVSMTYSTNLFTESIPMDRQSAIDAEIHVSLPDHPISFRNGPIKTHFDHAIRRSTIQTYQRYSSATLRSTAIKCLEEASYFKRKSWVKQVEISQEMVKNRVHRRMRRADNKIPAKSPSQPLHAAHITTPYKPNTLKAN